MLLPVSKLMLSSTGQLTISNTNRAVPHLHDLAYVASSNPECILPLSSPTVLPSGSAPVTFPHGLMSQVWGPCIQSSHFSFIVNFLFVSITPARL